MTPDTATLRAIIQRHLQVPMAATRRIVSIDRQASEYSTTFPLEELRVTLDTGDTIPMLFKDTSPSAVLPCARGVKPRFLYNPRREGLVYRDLAPLIDGAAACYGAVSDMQRGRHWLFLEQVAGVEMYQVGHRSTWRHVAGWLADMHRTLAASAVPQRLLRHLVRYDRAFYKLWLTRALRFAAMEDTTRGWRRHAGLSRLAPVYLRAIERLLALPVTVVHGEFYASNILVQRSRRVVRVCPVDWETAGIAPGLIDLAALVEGNWTPAERRAIAMAYWRRLGPVAWASSANDFLELLDCARLYHAIKWLGWARGWSPPQGQRRNWLADASAIARELEL